MAKSTVAVKFVGDVASLKRSITDVNRRMGETQGKFAKFGKVAAAGLTAAAGAAVVFGASAVKAGSDLNETLSKSNTVFGENAEAIEDWADTASSSFGQSKQEALEAASSFGNMFTQLGIGEDTAADMSQAMTELASDFASFHNADITEVLVAQQAAFRGEYDAVQRFVPTINAAAVEQKALEMGLADTTDELDAQDKALATQALLMEGAGDAAGDFARTSDGLANKQRTLSAQFKDVQAKIGQALIPIMVAAANVILTKVIPAVESIVNWLGENKEAAIALAAAVGGALVIAMTAYAVAAYNAAAATIAATWPFLLFVAAVAALTYALYRLTSNEGEGFLDWLQRVANTIAGVTRRVIGFFQNLWSWAMRVISVVKQVLSGIAQIGGAIPNSIPSLGPLRVPIFADGGVMPGPRGQHNLAMVAGGETILPTHKADSMPAGDVYNINVTAQHEPVAQAVVRELRRNKLLLAGA